MKTNIISISLIINIIIVASLFSSAQTDKIAQTNNSRGPIDDISLGELYINSVAHIYESYQFDGFYSNRPENHIIPIAFSGDIINSGNTNQTDVYFYAGITDGLNNLVYYDSSNVPNLNIGSTTTLQAPNYYTPTGIDDYNISISCNQAEIDLFPLDNISEDIPFSISEGIIARHLEYNDNYSSVEYGNANGFAGIIFTIAEVDTVLSVTVFIDSTSTTGVLIGQLYVYTNDTIGDAVLLIETEEYFLQSSDIGNWIELDFITINAGDDILDPGYRYLAGFEIYSGTGSVFIGTDTSGYHDYPIERLFYSGSSISLEEIPLINVKLAETFNSIATTSVINQLNIDIYPNPTNDILNISFDGNINKISSINILSILGEEINTAIPIHKNENTISIDLGNLPIGVYFIRVLVGNTFITRKIIKQ